MDFIPHVDFTEQPKMRFHVITDLHITNDKEHTHNKNLVDVLKDITSMKPASDGLMIVGDATDNGREDQYQELRRIFHTYQHALPETCFVQGNHDVRWGDWTEFSELFMKYTGMNAHYYDAWIKGYHFIFLGTERGLKDFSYLSKTQLKWLEEKLSEDMSSGKPVFLFHHQPLRNTVSGANESYHEANSWYGVRQDKELKLLLSKHPRAILFTGHTHWEIGSKDTMYNAKYATMFNAGAASYLWTDQNEHKSGSQGYVVEVYEHKVLVKGRDFLNDAWIANAQYEVDLSASVPAVDPAIDPDLTISNPTIQLVQDTYATGEPIQVAYTSSVGEDWIGLYPEGMNLGKSVEALAKLKPNNVQQPNGTLVFSGLKLPPGRYEAVYVGEAEYRTENDNLELDRVVFEIVEKPIGS
ncbi:metallophosphoesterase family protein [Paenibacillus sp. 1001270B_150601_E10]|uniref:metallophosphoesterase family protein n=1 Tax=Paenibacillus sp. 1001270B_150601_E10 TaxID=2787079 RepID=UPI00189FFBF5|nr:metallophosphoesterase [Paenibacillus sp. 1001270B_150601_E10]